MALVTRCPNCRTAFKVVADQLRVRGGLVRCGSCGTVFDGRACLEQPSPTQPPAPPPAEQPVSRLPEFSQAASAHPVLSQPAPAAEPPAVLRGRAGRQPIRADQSAGAEDAADPDDASFGALDDEPFEEADDDESPVYGEPPVYDEPPIYGEARTRYSSATDVGRAPPAFLDQDRIAAGRTFGRLWGWLCLAGLLALALQTVYAYRTPIAGIAPALRPALTQACQALGCTVGYARRIERIFIESSALRPPPGGAQPDEDGHSRLILTAVLRNRYDKDQEWPAITLELTDLSDTVVARKVIAPADYLPQGVPAGPMAAGSEVSLTVPIEVAGLKVNGYQLDKFFP